MSLTEASEHVSICKSGDSGLSRIVGGEGIDNGTATLYTKVIKKKGGIT